MPYDVIVGRNESDKKLFGKKGLAYLGKSFVKMGQTSSLSNPIYLDVARSHVVLVSGKRGSGKSYTLGVIAEALSSLKREESKNIAPLIFDTMGIFWTMKFKNEKDKALLREWGLEESNVPIKVYSPLGYFNEYRDMGVEVDEEFAIKISDLDISDWISLFGLKFTSPISFAIEAAIGNLKERESFGFEDIKKEIFNLESVSLPYKNSAVSLFDAAKTWKIFDEEKGFSIDRLIKAGETTVIDLSMYASVSGFNVRGLVISLVCKNLFKERTRWRKEEEIDAVNHGFNYLINRKVPLVWVFIDEAHEFLPLEGETPATEVLVQLLREGRQPGISLVLATQQPGKIHTDAMTQSDIVISHRVTAEPDVRALNGIMQSYLYESINKKLNDLPRLKGTAIILDDNSERIYPMRVRPRFTWHGGEAPSSVSAEDNL